MTPRSGLEQISDGNWTERTLGLIWDIKKVVFRVCFNIQKDGKTKR